jgi:hypothetical protein
MDHEDRKQIVFNTSYCLLLQVLNRKSMFAALHSDINSFKSGLIHLSGQTNFGKARAAQVKDIIISESKFFGTISVDPKIK